MSRSLRALLSPTVALAATLIALPLTTRAALAQSDAAAPPSADSAARAPDSAVAKPHKSRFGGIGHAFHKAASKVGEKTGISGETAKKIAITAATGGAGAALLHSSAAEPAGSDSGSQSLAGHVLPGGLPSLHRPGASGAAPAAPASPDSSAATPGAAPMMPPAGASGGADAQTERALRATQELARIATLGAQGDPDAKHAMAVLDSAMAAPRGDLAKLQKRAIDGDANASRALIIREAEIADSALPPGKRALAAAPAAAGHDESAHHPARPRARHHTGATPS